MIERGATEKVKRKNGHQRTMFNPNQTLELRRVGRGRKSDRIEDKCVICSDPSILAIQVMSKIVFCLCNNLHNPDCSENMSKNMSEEERRRQERQFAELINLGDKIHFASLVINNSFDKRYLSARDKCRDAAAKERKGIETWPEEINDVNDPSQFPTPAEAAAAAKKTPRQRTISNASTTSTPGSAPATPLPQKSNVWRLRHNCSDCEEKFGLKSELTEHMKSKHGKTPHNMIVDMAREIIDGIIENCCELKIEGVKNSTPEDEVINNSCQNLTITNNNIKTKANNNLRFYVSNVRGFFSKKVILEKILYDLDVNICILSETHTLDEVSPNLPHFRTFRRNRTNREKGGIAVLISNDIARDCVLVWEGIGDNEAIAILLSGTNPKVIIVANYGTQPNSFGVSIPSNNLMEIQAKVTECEHCCS